MLKNVGMKALAFFAVFIFVLAINGKGQAASLSDIPQSSAEEINYLIERDVISGYSDGTFRPTQAVTRAEAAIMLGIALELDGTKRATSFIDVEPGSTASGYIQSAVEANIISGYSDSTYRPQNPITRSEMAYLLQRGFNLTETSDIYFTDIARSGAQYEAINKIATAGLTVGYSDGTYRPTKNVTRQEFAIFVARGLNESFRVEVVTAQAPVATYGEVTADVLNVRSSPSNSAPAIGTLAEGTVVTVYSFDGFWAKINYNNQQAYVHKTYLKLKNATGSVLQDRIIVIDPGHGGKDPGTSNGILKEKDIVLAVSNLVSAKLRAEGANVIMTRSGDTYPDLQNRVDTSRAVYGEIFVSIHVNAGPESATGTETFYDTSQNANGTESYELAKEIQAQIVALADMNDKGEKNNDFYVLRNQNIPSVLVELGFLSNSEDRAKLSSPEYQELYAEAIFRGIKSYYSK